MQTQGLKRPRLPVTPPTGPAYHQGHKGGIRYQYTVVNLMKAVRYIST